MSFAHDRMGRAGRATVEAEFDIAQESQRLVRILTGALAGEAIAVRPEVHAGGAMVPVKRAAVSEPVLAALLPGLATGCDAVLAP